MFSFHLYHAKEKCPHEKDQAKYTTSFRFVKYERLEMGTSNKLSA